MAVVEVSLKEFRDRQKSLFDLADKGDKIIIRRGKKQAYTMVPVEDDDDDQYFTPEMLDKIDLSLQQAKEGKVFAMQEGETLDDFLNRIEGCIK